jgi:hypothetical protein
MLADQVVLSSVEIHGLTARVIGAEKPFDLDEAEQFDRRRDRATRRMVEAAKLLHLIRTKAAPALQLNVQQRVTVEAPAIASGDGTLGIAELLESRGTSQN